MTDDFLTPSTGAPNIPDGSYPLILLSISAPKTITTVDGDVEIREWLFAIDEGELNGTEVPESTSMAMGPKSKAFKWMTALLGGKPEVGKSYPKDQLVGRRIQADIVANEKGWPRIDYVRPMQAAALGARFAAATGAPTNEPVAAASPIRQQVAADADASLPF